MMRIQPSSLPWHRRALLVLGSIGPFGYLPASGTVTVAVLGTPIFWMFSRLGPVAQLTVIVLFSAAAMWLHHVGDELLGEKDSRKLVWDEVAGFLLAIAFLPFTWQVCAAAILVERVIDVAKVPPANWIDRKWHNGVAVVADDLFAGAYTCLLLHLSVYLFPERLGIPIAAI